jgi:hypothetical protein
MPPSEYPLRVSKVIPLDHPLFERLHAELIHYIGLGCGRHKPDPRHEAVGLIDVMVDVHSVPPLGQSAGPYGQILVQFKLQDGRSGHFMYRVIAFEASLDPTEAERDAIARFRASL